MLYNAMLVSAVQPWESVVTIYILSLLSLPPTSPPQPVFRLHLTLQKADHSDPLTPYWLHGTPLYQKTIIYLSDLPEVAS